MTEYFPRGEGTAPDYEGRPLDRAPEFTATGGYTYSYPLSNGGTLSGNIRERWSDDYVVTVFATPRQYNNPSYTRTDVGVTYTAADDKWYVQAYGENLEDEILVLGADTLWKCHAIRAQHLWRAGRGEVLTSNSVNQLAQSRQWIADRSQY